MPGTAAVLSDRVFRPRVPPGQEAGRDVDKFSRCMRKFEFEPLGIRCDEEHTACALGGSCREVPGILYPDRPFSRIPPPRAVYCV